MSSGVKKVPRYIQEVTPENVDELSAALQDSQPSTSFGGSGGGGGRPEVSALRKVIHNEQVKLRATFLNTTGAGFIVAGLITPLTALGVGTGTTVVSANQAFALMGIWLVSAAILHYGGTLTLEATI